MANLLPPTELMYIYLGVDTSATPDLDTAFARTSLLGVYPSTRGRPAKNHEKMEFADFEFNVALVDSEDADSITSLGEMRAKVSSGAVTAIDSAIVEVPAATPAQHAAAALVGFLADAIKSGVYSSNVVNQLNAVVPTLAKALDTLTTSPAQYDALKTIANVLEANKKLINAILAAQPGNGLWWSAPSTFTPAPSASTPPAGDKEENADEDNTPVESIKMATATANFGFGRLTGESATATMEKPELKLKSAPELNDEADVSGVFMPKPDDTYIINEQVAQLFKILQISRQNCPQNVNLIGPHGCGKTELAIQFAARLGLPLLIMDCANLREARDWFGYKTAREGTVYWHESQFVKAVAAGNHVILLDELNRANPHLLNTLMPLLDARRFTYLEEKGDKICVGPGTVFFSSMNEGAGYTGTSALDRAIRDRFPRVVELSYLGEADEIALLVKRVGIDENLATRLVQMAHKIRQDATGISASLTESLSTRQLIAAAHDFAIGGVDTLTFTIINHFSADGDDDSERVRVQSIIQGKFGDMIAAAAEKAAKKGA